MSRRGRTPTERITALALALGVAGAFGTLASATTGGASVLSSRARCRSTVFVPNYVSNSVSTIDVKTRKKNPTDIPVGAGPSGMAVTPDGKTVFVTNGEGTSVSAIDVKTRTKYPTDIDLGAHPAALVITPDGKTVFVAKYDSAADTATTTAPGPGSVATIDVKTRTKGPTEIPLTVGYGPSGMAITPDGKTLFVISDTSLVSTIDVATRTKDPTDIDVGASPSALAITPDGKTVFITNYQSGSVSTIDVTTRKKSSTDIRMGEGPSGVAITPCHPRKRGG